MRLVARKSRRERRPIVRVGQISVDAVDIQEAAYAFVDYCRSAERAQATRPIY